MRYEPIVPVTEQEKKENKERVEKICQKVAIVVAFISVFVFLIKIMFL